MNRNSFLILLLLAAGMVVVTASVRVLSPDYRVSEGYDSPAFPGFKDAVNTAQSVSLEVGGKRITLSVGAGGDWSLPERGGYPADSQAVREMLLALARMTAAQQKTKKADRYHRIQVEDSTDDPESKSRHLVIRGREGAILLDAIFGKTVSALQGVPDGGIYYRVAGAEQAWLSNGKIDPGVEVEGWIERQIIDVKRERMRTVTLRHADGEIVAIRQTSDGSGKLMLEGIPEGYRLKSEYRRDSIAGFLTELMVSDVARPGDLDLSGKSISETRYETDDGLSVTLELSGDEETGHWIGIAVRGDGEARQEAADISARVDGWLFRIDNWKSGDLKRRMADLVEPDVSDEEAGTSTGG